MRHEKVTSRPEGWPLEYQKGELVNYNGSIYRFMGYLEGKYHLRPLVRSLTDSDFRNGDVKANRASLIRLYKK